MNELVEQQLQDNAISRDRWDLYRSHRDKVTGLLQRASVSRSRLCILGAGNCNDLNLAALLAVHDEVHLVDLDLEALEQGVSRQRPANRSAVYLHGGVDLTGVLPDIALWSPDAAITDVSLTACTERPVKQVASALPGPFEVVASTCLLPLMIYGVVRTAGEHHPRFVDALQAVRAGHLRLLAGLVAPGGTGVLVNHFVSSETFPSLTSVPEDQLSGVLPQLIQERNFFHGVNPLAVSSFFRSDPVVAPQIVSVGWESPWRWNFGPRVYLVGAWTFRKSAAAAAA